MFKDVVENCVSTIFTLGIFFHFLFTANLDVFRNMLEPLFHFQVSQISKKNPKTSSWLLLTLQGNAGFLGALLCALQASLSRASFSPHFPLDFRYGCFCFVTSGPLGFIGSWSCAFPHLRIPGQAGSSTSKQSVDQGFSVSALLTFWIK